MVSRLFGPVAIPSHFYDRNIAGGEFEFGTVGRPSERRGVKLLPWLRILGSQVEFLVGPQQENVRRQQIDR